MRWWPSPWPFSVSTEACLLALAGLTSLLGIVLVIVFFVTSSDSGSLVIDMITAGGKTDAPIAQRVFWCSFEGGGGDPAAGSRGLGADRAAGQGGSTLYCKFNQRIIGPDNRRSNWLASACCADSVNHIRSA
ncbi:BCCT family transporter [Zobellella denitrificans]